MKKLPSFLEKMEKKNRTLFVQIFLQFMIDFSKSQDKTNVSSSFKITQKLSSSLEKSTFFDDFFQIHQLNHTFFDFQIDGQNVIN